MIVAIERDDAGNTVDLFELEGDAVEIHTSRGVLRIVDHGAAIEVTNVGEGVLSGLAVHPVAGNMIRVEVAP